MDVLNKNTYLIKENVMPLKPEFGFDIFDSDTNEVVMKVREKDIRGFARFFRFSSYKRTTPFDLSVKTIDQKPVLRIKRGIPRMASRVKVYDYNGELIGGFNQKPFSLRPIFDVVAADESPVCGLRGGFTGSSFQFMTSDNIELARVVKKWAGAGKELLTSSDDYVLQIDEAVPENSMIRKLILASALCVGLIVKIEVP